MNVPTRLALGLLTAMIGIFFGGAALEQLWKWFVVPLGVPTISLPHALGLSATLHMFLGTRGLYFKRGEDEDDRIIFNLAASAVLPATFLAFGYVYTLFM